MKSTFLKNAVLGAVILSLSAVSPFAAAHRENISDAVWADVGYPTLHAGIAASFPFHHAANHNDMTQVNRWITNGIDVNAKDNGGWTALHWAADTNAVDIVALLLGNGANINARNNNDFTALHTAAYFNAQETAALLLARGADINAKTDRGWTALHRAADENSIETAALLLSHGADINATDNNGYTALHEAANKNAKETVELLLGNGADINATDNDGNTALQEANGETAEVLRNYTLGQFAHLRVTPAGSGGGGGSGSGVGVAIGAIAVIGLAAWAFSSGDTKAFNFTPHYRFSHNDGFSSYSYGSRVDFQKDNISAFWDARQAISGGETSEWIYTGEMKYAKDFWHTKYASQVQGKTADMQFSAGGKWKSGIWQYQSGITAEYGITETTDDFSAFWRNSITADFGGWRLLPSANFYWRGSGNIWESGNFRIDLRRTF